MKWDGDRLVQIMPENTDSKLKPYSGIVGMANAKGEFIGYGEQGIAYKIIDDKILTPPAALKSSQYMLTYKKGDNTPKSTVITIGTEGDNVWFQGLKHLHPGGLGQRHNQRWQNHHTDNFHWSDTELPDIYHRPDRRPQSLHHRTVNT